MNITTGDVWTFKLTSGEELITKVIGDAGPNELLISEPVSVAPGPQGMGLVPSLFTVDTDSEIRLNMNSVTVYGLTEENVKNKYIEATTGITVPSKKLILG
jgi:hypothetical protein